MMGKAITRAVYRGDGLMTVIGEEEWDEVANWDPLKGRYLSQ